MSEKKNQSSQNKLTVKQRRALLSAHILFSVAWIGVGLSLIALILLVANGNNVAGIFQAAFTIADDLHGHVYIPLAIGTGVSGVILSALTPWRFLKFKWIIIKEAVIIVVIGSGVALVPRAFKAIIQIISTNGLTSLNNSGYWTNLYILLGYFILQIVLVSASAVLSVFKPFGQRGRNNQT